LYPAERFDHHYSCGGALPLRGIVPNRAKKFDSGVALG